MLFLSATAFATAFQGPTAGSTSTFNYTWTDAMGAPIATGNTTYTFTSVVMDNSPGHCAGLSGCMSGTFTTGNSGEGLYNTTLATGSCVVDGFSLVCDVNQFLSFSYVGTGALYTGQARLGTQEFLFGFIPLGYTVAPQPYTGTMVLSGGTIGSFIE